MGSIATGLDEMTKEEIRKLANDAVKQVDELAQKLYKKPWVELSSEQKEIVWEEIIIPNLT